MPSGLVIMKWDDRIGTTILAQYPEEVSIADKTLMQIYSTHEYTGDVGLISMNVGPLNIASYYTGAESGIYIILSLNMEEDPEVFEDGLSDAARLIISNLSRDAYKPLIPSLFQRLSVYPSLNEERKLAMLYTDEAKRMVIKRLQEEGSLLKSEITVWLKDHFIDGFVDMEALIQSLIKENLVKSRSVKGNPSDIIYLVNDIFITRAPPTQLVKEAKDRGLPEHLVDTFKSEVKNFFSDYRNSEEDNIKLLELLLDPPVYETISLMRQSIVTRDDLEKLQKKGVDDVDDVLKKLWGVKMILVLRDSDGNEYYGLQSDVKIRKIFPDYNLNMIRKQYAAKIKSTQVQLEYIDALRDMFNSNLQDSKKRNVKEITN